MFVSLVKIKKYSIYLLLFLFFNCFFTNTVEAVNLATPTEYDVPDPDSTPAETGNSQIKFARGITFNNDGKRMFVSGLDGTQQGIRQFDLSVGFDLSSTITPGSKVGKSRGDVTNEKIANPYSIRFNNDGTKLFFLQGVSTTLREFTLSTAFDITSVSAHDSSDTVDYTLTDTGSSSGFAFNSDGTKLFVADFSNNQIDVYSLSVGFDLDSTISYQSSQSLDISAESEAPRSVIFSRDGTTMFVLQSNQVDEYVLTTGYDLTTAKYVDSKGGTGTQPWAIELNRCITCDGRELFLAVNNHNKIRQHRLPAAYNLTTPTLSSSVPADDATNVALDANIVLTFSEDMDVEEDNITIKKTSGDTTVETIDVTSSQVTGTGTTTITINPSSDLEENTEYYVLIDADAFDDGSDASYAGITSTTALSFTTANSAPTLVSSIPADDATDVAIDANIVLNFSESVNADDGDIVIYKTSGGTTVETIASTASNVTGSGTSQITINPSADFEYGVEYYVLIDSGAFDDDNDEDYTGITSTTALSFTINNRVDPTTIKDVVGSIDAQSESAKNYIIQSIDTVSNRLRYLRQNRISNSLSSQNLQIDVGNTILTSLANDNLQKNTNSIMPNNWSTWSSGTISVAKIGDSINSSSQETEGQGVVLGFDKKLSDSDFLGFAIQYGQSDTDIGTNGTSIDSENMNFSIYRTKPLDDNNFIETFLGVGLIESDLKRVHNSNILTGSRDGTQIFGSINYGKTIDRGDFNITPIGRLDLGLTELYGYTETGTDALSYAKQRIENGLASFGFEFSDNIKLNENKLRPFGSLTFITNFSNSSDAKMNYVADTSTIYTYTQKANSNHLISSMIGLTYTAGDYLNINSSYSRVQGNKSEQRDTLDIAINFISNRETQYSLSLAGDENAEAKLSISKNIYGFDLEFNASESFSANPNQEAKLMLTYNF